MSPPPPGSDGVEGMAEAGGALGASVLDRFCPTRVPVSRSLPQKPVQQQPLIFLALLAFCTGCTGSAGFLGIREP